MSKDDFAKQVTDQMSSSLMRRNVDIELGVREAAVDLVATAISIYMRAENPEVRLGATRLLNVTAEMTHTLGMIPRDVIQAAVDKRLSGDTGGDVRVDMRDETVRRTREKIERIARGEITPDATDDGLWVGYDLEDD